MDTLSTVDFLKVFDSASPTIIYTDGACSGNPGPGGWGAIIQNNNQELELSGGASQTTNNRMELLAAIESLSVLPAGTSLTLFTDSQYLRTGITEWIHRWRQNGWKTSDKKEVKNCDLWQRLDTLTKTHTIAWEWVKGHSGQPYNERADGLARKAIIAIKMAE